MIAGRRCGQTANSKPREDEAIRALLSCLFPLKSELSIGRMADVGAWVFMHACVLVCPGTSLSAGLSDIQLSRWWTASG